MKPEHFDAVIVGAGLSGIGMACHLQRKCANKRYVIFESRESIGGTWDLFRYPGVRADSDMHTLSYNFKAWRGEREIADGSEILDYIREVAADHDITGHIRFGHSVVKVTWSSEKTAWTIHCVHRGTGETVQVTCNMLLMCPGYYRYDEGHTPDFAGSDTFKGHIVHPQHWPADLEYAGKQVVVIGSGATAVSMTPVLAKEASHVVMLQRTPTYLMSRPEASRLWQFMRNRVPASIAFAISRWWNQKMSGLLYQRSRSSPDRVKRFLLGGIRKELGPDYNIEKHFSPDYNPWDQRLCLVRNGDLFAAMRAGTVSIVTDSIDHFTEHGIRLTSGDELKADVVVTATGLKMEIWGGVSVEVDGRAVQPADTITYKGTMNSDVPNLVTTFGYVNASWTLRADLIADFTCRLIRYMDQQQVRQCTPRVPESLEEMETRPFIEGFTPNYINRAVDLMPRQGDREPWLNSQDYQREKHMFRAPLEDGSLVFR